VAEILTTENFEINPLNAELNPICHLLALLGAHHILHISRIRVKESGSKEEPRSSGQATVLSLFEQSALFYLTL
jgi:hypothetical protein